MGKAAALGPHDVICSYFTLAGAMGAPTSSFAERVAAVAGAGYSGIGMMLRDYEGAIESGLTDADLRAIVDDHGICVAEVEFLGGWWFDDERVEASRASEATLLHMADVFEARHLNVSAGAASPADEDLETAGTQLGALCDRAADHGLLVAIEFMGVAVVKDVATAGRMLDVADRPNAGLDLDVYHYFRSTSTDEDLRAIGNRVHCIQLGDAAGVEGEWNIEETTQRRLLPGEGDLDVVGMLRTLREMGVTTPPSVEILSVEQWQLPLDEQASRSYQATRAVLDQVRA
jgi:sugar phosphate isomerase/epimerase